MSLRLQPRQRLAKAWSFLKLLRVEPVLFLIAFQTGLKDTANRQLVEDKICTLWYHATNSYCYDLPSIHETDNRLGHFKSRILADSTEFGTYHTYITTPIGIIWALFIGAWVDRYVKARKLIMLAYCVAGIVENSISVYLSIKWDTSIYYSLLPYLPALLLVGGTAGPNIAAIHYTTSTTPPKLFAIRFMIFQSCNTFGIPIGRALGGYILVQKPKFPTGEIRNYTICYLIALTFEVMALLWVTFMVNERVARKQELNIEMKIRGIEETPTNERENIKLNSDISMEDKNVHPLRLLFDLENIKTMIRTIIRKRSNKARKQILLLTICLAIFHGEAAGLSNLSDQFAEKVYLWRPDWTAYMKSITIMVSGISTMAIIPFLIKSFNVGDIDQAFIGYCVIFLSNVLKGSWSSQNAYYTAIVVGAFHGLARICTKSHIAKIVDRDEMGKIMSFLSALETLTPLLATTVFAYIFKYTIDSYPGAVFQLIAGLMLIPVFVLMWIQIYTKRPYIETVSRKVPGYKCDHDNLDKKILNVRLKQPCSPSIVTRL